MSILTRLLDRLYARWRTVPAREEPKPTRHFVRGLCPHCGELDTILTADGEPHRRWHTCPVIEAITEDPSLLAAAFNISAETNSAEPDPMPEVDPRRDPLVGVVREVGTEG